MNQPQILWKTPPAELSLAAGEIHVFAASLNQPLACVERMGATLSSDEQARAQRLKTEKDRNNFIVARGLLREILGWQLRTQPGGLAFSYNPQGKPQLNGAHKDLQFNVAHSESLAVFALAAKQEIGVDIEYLKPLSDIDSLAATCFSPEEFRQWQSAPKDSHHFYQIWTRKEAYLKARGLGLGESLTQVEISPVVGSETRFLCRANSSEPFKSWSILPLNPADNFTSCVAIENEVSRLACWQWVGLSQS